MFALVAPDAALGAGAFLGAAALGAAAFAAAAGFAAPLAAAVFFGAVAIFIPHLSLTRQKRLFNFRPFCFKLLLIHGFEQLHRSFTRTNHERPFVLRQRPWQNRPDKVERRNRKKEKRNPNPNYVLSSQKRRNAYNQKQSCEKSC